MPTQEKQARKLKDLKTGFNMFNTTKSKAEDASSVVYERTFQTPQHGMRQSRKLMRRFSQGPCLNRPHLCQVQ